METQKILISIPKDSQIVAINIVAGERRNYDTLVDVRVGPIVILGVSVIDDHLVTATAYLPSDITVSDGELEEAIKGAAIAYHYGVDEASMKEQEEYDKKRELGE